MARLLQVFAPGIPQVYYVGLLAGKNDIKLLEETKEGRNINRHYYTKDEVAEEMKRPVVASLLKLLSFRNNEDAFDLNGEIDVETPNKNSIIISRSNADGSRKAVLEANLKDLTYSVKVNGEKIEF